MPQWAFNIGGGGEDDGHACAIGPDGKVYLSGSFSGIMDLDPSTNTFNVTSSGPSDIFVACYTNSGNFLWGFSIGGPAYDGVYAIAIDHSNNIVIAGYFSGQNVDFDPGPGVRMLSDQGPAGGGSGAGGDGFAAKYTSTGQCQWAIDLGGSSYFDIAEAVTTDGADNVYVGGDFHYTMDIDPSAGSHVLDASTGTAYLIKYTPGGQLIWGFNFGGNMPGLDNTVVNIENRGNRLYVDGCFNGTSDFDPSVSGSANFTATGVYDAYLAKYDTAGNYKFAIAIGGSKEDQSRGLALDSAENIYVGGYSYSPLLTFGPSSTTLTSPSGTNFQDIFIAKYDSSGHYQWAKEMGGSHDDVLYGIAISHRNLYYTGYFHDTVDFDPSAGIANLVSNGQGDIYLCKNDLDGNYVCAFGIGEEGSERPRQVMTDTAGYLYMCGVLASGNTDADPTNGSYILNTNGGGDALFIKYDWRTTPLPADGYLTGDTICAGTTAMLSFIATNGTAPFTITYTDGISVDTLSNINSGDYISVSPGVTTSYRLLSMQGTGICVPLGYPDTACVVLVHPRPAGYAGKDTMLCPGVKYMLQASGGNSYEWFPSLGLNNAGIADPTLTANNTIYYHVAVIDVYGCADTAGVLISVRPALFAVEAPAYVCKGDSARVTASGGDTYIWWPDSLVSNSHIADPVLKPLLSTDYTVVITEHTCGRSDTLAVNMLVRDLPDVVVSSVYDIDCGNKNGALTVTGAESYLWTPATGLDDAHSARPKVSVAAETKYFVKGTDAYGCSNTDSAIVDVFNEGTGRLFVPNAFTPNGDGKNDCFRVRAPGGISDFELMVFDRWGKRIFISYNAAECWDGNYGGVPQPVGTYFYKYSCLSDACGYVKGKGDVVLVR